MNQISFPRTGYDGISRTQQQIEQWYVGQIMAEIRPRLNAVVTRNDS